jgi:protein-disulfide isomerase/uncharacterized membrane protein
VDWQLVGLRLLAVAGLGASSAALADHLAQTPFFCGFASGCDEVTHSAYGQLAGVPVSGLGVAAFAAFLIVTLFPTRAGRLIGPLALAAGAAGLALFLIQAFVLEQFCQLCLIADVCGMGMALLQVLSWRSFAGAPIPRRWAWAALAGVAVAAPILVPPLLPQPQAPAAVRDLWASGKVNVVVVTDFECAACRQTHAALTTALAGRDDVQVVYLVYPMPYHQNARHAARAHWFAKSKGRGAEMAAALFAAADLSPAGCEKLVRKLGLDVDAYRVAAADPATDTAIDAATAWAPQSGARGLPLVWVQDRPLFGLQPAEAFRAALDRAEPAP